MEPEDHMFEAKQEMKRADHLIYVSLKYTRTVDVIKSVLERLINTYDNAINALLEKLKEEGKIENNPVAIVIKCSTLKEKYDDEELNEHLDFFLLLRKVAKADFSRAREFRRNVTMGVPEEGRTIEINIDIVTEYYKKSIDFLDYISKTYFKKK